eukprot:Plantae.Rhodophyta-Purpureofilum_apyrenoidigerum.ctg16702.p1 GENE.Plantae.Rhodophyta-Purpureofilum_apyrenoidigerum.ctg16702~~Plantae.Rhodophyta-Purpureofilum_apyrenoidigerum.ctg16702.p1  ORF type:complete len:429 (+),score=45.63 Plantae.Rhodophyta-Purpureofilum_apyrenoidigerum.ctg16702:82-1368(+)
MDDWKKWRGETGGMGTVVVTARMKRVVWLVCSVVLLVCANAEEALRTEAATTTRGKLSIVHVIGVWLMCVAISALAAKRSSRTFASRISNVTTGIVAITFLVFFYQGVVAAAAIDALSWKRFFQFMLAGGICAFLTHAACTPIDVVKTRLQTQVNRYSGAVDALQTIIREEGPAALLKGLGATATGYFLHGAFKYSFYEVFKVILAKSPEVAIHKPPLAVAALAGFLAECVACILLCPMEAVRIRSVADPNFPPTVVGGLQVLIKTEGVHGLYKGLFSLLLRQVPYTVGQFVSFEFALVFVKFLVEPFFRETADTISSSGAMIISTGAGVLAGAMASVISQPGDTILSKINQEESDDSSPVTQVTNMIRKLGFSGLFLGLGTRLVQVSCMIGGQFLIYDTIKMLCGIRTASSVSSNVVSTIPVETDSK